MPRHNMIYLKRNQQICSRIGAKLENILDLKKENKRIFVNNIDRILS